MDQILQIVLLLILLEVIKTIKNNRPPTKDCGYFFIR